MAPEAQEDKGTAKFTPTERKKEAALEETQFEIKLGRSWVDRKSL